MHNNNSDRLVVPFSNWPENDRRLWELGCTPRGPFEDPFAAPSHGAALRPASQAKVKKGYGRWLAFLHERGWAEPDSHPAERVTLPRLGAYLLRLRACGNTDNTVMGRFVELRMAMRVMAPDHDTQYILRPNGTSLRAVLDPRNRWVPVPDLVALWAWGLSLIAAAIDGDSDAAFRNLRDGLLIAILTCRARRISAMAHLRLGHEVLCRPNGVTIDLPPDLVKTGRPDRFDLPSALGEPFARYLQARHTRLRRGRHTVMLWIDANGNAITLKGLSEMIRRRSLARFGYAFGPHRFRHAMASALPERLPSNPGLAATVLGISPNMVLQSYDRAAKVTGMRSFLAMHEAEQADAVEDWERRCRLATLRRDPQP